MTPVHPRIVASMRMQGLPPTCKFIPPSLTASARNYRHPGNSFRMTRAYGRKRSSLQSSVEEILGRMISSSKRRDDGQHHENRELYSRIFQQYNLTSIDSFAASHHATKKEPSCDTSGPTVFVAPCGYTNMGRGRLRPVPSPSRLPAYPQGPFPPQLCPPTTCRPSFPVQSRARQE